MSDQITAGRETHEAPESDYKGRLIKNTSISQDYSNNNRIHDIPYHKPVTGVIYAAQTPQESAAFRYKPDLMEDTSPKDFPWEIPDPTPRRSTVHFEPDLQCPRKTLAEKPIEYLERSFLEDLYNNRRVSQQSANSSGVQERDSIRCNTQQKPVLRFRPRSSSSDRRDSIKFMPLRSDEVEVPPPIPSKYVRNFPIKPIKHASTLATDDGGRLLPVTADKLKTSVTDRRRSIVMNNDVDELRTSMVGIPIRYSRRSSISGIRPQKRRLSIRQADINETSDILENQREQQQVFAVPVVPARGRSRSILQQSVKTLASKYPHDLPAVHRKNIRYSNDADLFSADGRRMSARPPPPEYVSMEGGHPMLVSELLNPISTLFINDFKDTVPKDPLTKPQESNVWLRPRDYTLESRPMPRAREAPRPVVKPMARARAVYRESMCKPNIVQGRKSQTLYKYKQESSSSDDENNNMRNKKKQNFKGNAYKKQYRYVYSAETPDINFQDNGKYPSFKRSNGLAESISHFSSNTDFCGLNCAAEEPLIPKVHRLMNRKLYDVPSPRTSHTINERELLCHPNNRISSSIQPTNSKSKLKWRITIKKSAGDER